MLVARTVAELHAALPALRDRAAGGRVGFVPTMGALHAGHRSLVDRARADSRVAVVSIFVNPLQFELADDLARYPRDPEGDVAALREWGAELAVAPSIDEVWPAPPVSRVHVAGVAERLEGADRPGHFDGVATVVAKLLHLVGPCRAYFGHKDAQQLAVVRRMVADLAFDAEVVACPTVREPDGLAVSSRNALLGPEDRRAATAIYRGLCVAAERFAAGERESALLEATVAAVLAEPGRLEPCYVAVADPTTFERPPLARPADLLAVAARAGSTRLIDNVTLG